MTILPTSSYSSTSGLDSTSFNCNRSKLSSMHLTPQPPDMLVLEVRRRPYRYQGSHTARRVRSSCQPSLSGRLQSRPRRCRQDRFWKVCLFSHHLRHRSRTRRRTQRNVRSFRRREDRVHLHRGSEESYLAVPLRLVGIRPSVDDTPGRYWPRWIRQFRVVCQHYVV